MARFDVVPEQRVHEPRFHSVAEAAAILGLSPITLYRAIAAGDFLSATHRGLIVVPAEVVQRMSEAARLYGTLMRPANRSAEGSMEDPAGVHHLD
jgi:hypothetical protein